MPYKCKAQYYFELNFNPREKWSRFNFNIPMIYNNNLLYFTATYTQFSINLQYIYNYNNFNQTGTLFDNTPVLYNMYN